jgi:chromosome segregation ATPase
MKILESLLKFGAGFDKLTAIGKYAVIGVAIFLISYMFGKSNSKNEFAEFQAKYEEYQRTSQNAIKYSDSLKTEVNSLRDQNTKKDSTIKTLTISISFKNKERAQLRNSLASLENRIDSSVANADTATLLVLKDSAIVNLKAQVETADSVIVQQESVVKLQNEKIVNLNSALLLSETRADSLTKVLQALPTTPKNPDKFLFGLLPKPSRTVVAVVSFASGAILASQLRR